jgi:hypothetical protein
MALYAYARRNGATPERSRDAVYSFLAHVRAGMLVDGPGRAPDRLRVFLLQAFEDYLIRMTPPPLPSGRQETRPTHSPDFSSAEAWLKTDLAKTDSPETAFHRAWARCVLTQSHAVLKGELTARLGDKAAEMIAAEISPVERRPFNAELAPKMKLSPSEVLETLRSSRRRLREIMLETLRDTVSSSADVEVEFWDLFKSV